jgi:hypothetical protein
MDSMALHTNVNATSKESTNRPLDVTWLWIKVALVTVHKQMLYNI